MKKVILSKIILFTVTMCFVSMANAYQKYLCSGQSVLKEKLPSFYDALSEQPVILGTLAEKQISVLTYTEDEMSGGATVLELTISSHNENGKLVKQKITSLAGFISYSDSELSVSCSGFKF